MSLRSWWKNRRETKRLRKEVERLRREECVFADAKAGRTSTSRLIAAELVKELRRTEQELKLLRLQEEARRLREKLAHEREEMEKEITRRKKKMSEETKLVLTSPLLGDRVQHNQPLAIRWDAAGPLGDFLRIELLKRSFFLRKVAPDAPTETGEFLWTVPREVPPAGDYQIRLFDGVTEAVSPEFEVFS